ncbi:MAG: polymorphic toxin-type HINT domain-containing protein, partial [Bacteroidia bacterium]|nr:polymorphic toxin-type HINT domain-containing protein [Bacteroidia bacterium]
MTRLTATTISSGYNEYRADHYNSVLGEWGYKKTVTDYDTRLGETTTEIFVVDPKKKKENPVLFKLNQMNGGGLDFSGAKFGMSGYENLPWYKTKVDVFGVNSAKSAWNQVVDMAQTSANGLFSSSGRKDVFAGVDNLVKGTMNWLFTASGGQKVDDIIDFATDVHNSENFAGGIMLGRSISMYGRIGIDPKILKPKPWGCFTKGTKIWADSGLVNIEDIKAGDIVFAYNVKNKRVVTRKVAKSYIRVVNQLVKLEYGNEVIFTTSEHPFYVGNTWIEASKLQVGDLLFLHDKSVLPIKQISIIDTVVNVYNFTVEDEHNYYVGESKVLVHNNDCGQPLKNISGNLKDAANAARNQQYGSNTNVWRRLPITAQDVQDLEEAQL